VLLVKGRNKKEERSLISKLIGIEKAIGPPKIMLPSTPFQ
jgi:hypothetical protein